MSNHYFVLCQHADGLYTPERNWSDMDMNSTKRDLKAGRFQRPALVLSINDIDRTCCDVTEQFARYFPLGDT